MSVTGQEPLPAGQAVGFGAMPVRALFDVGTLTGLTDGQLLERFTLGRRELAEAAFTLLVQRHGPMVLRVCQQVLGDPHDADDVFQATFLLLARKAGSIRRENAVASWVYGVARRLSLQSRRLAARRRELERKRLLRSGPTKPLSGSPPDLWPELYEELDRLPQPFRAAIVLCDLEGNTYEQAAGMLHCPVGTIQSRLFRGRQRLRRGLERRGLGSALALGGGRSPLASMTPGVPKQLTASLAHSAASLTQGQPIGGSISATVVTLMGSELKREVLRRFLTASIAVVVAGIMVAGAVGLMFGQGERGAKARGAVASPNARLHAARINVRVVDIQGRPVPGAKVNAVEFSSRAPIQSFTTDLQGHVEIPRVNTDLNLQVLARGLDGSLAWAQVGYRQPDDQPEGTQADPLVMKLVPLGHIAQGSVVDPSGQPIAGAEVMAQGFQAPHGVWVSFMFRSGDLPLPRSVTDQAGRFTINLPSGAEANANVRHARFLGPGKVIGASDKSVGPFVLEPAGGIAGRVIDATGQPVPRALVETQLTEYRARILGGWGETQADDQGRFAITGLEPGVYNLLFEEAPGRPTTTARAVEGLRVQAGHNTAALMKVIEGRPLHGIVIDQATNQPIVGIDVGCYGPARPQSGAAVDSRKTDASGRFTFYVPAGEHYVYMMDGNSYSRLSRSTVDVPEEGEIEALRLIRIGLSDSSQSSRYTMKAAIRPSEPAKAKAKPKEKRDVAENKEVPAAAFRTLTGRVHSPNGEPLVGIQVTVDPGMPAPNVEPERYDIAATDREGVFILPGLPRRPLQINLHRSGFQVQSENVPADKEQMNYIYKFKIDTSSRFRPAPKEDDPVPTQLVDRLTSADLSHRGTEFLADGPGGSGNDLNRLTRGIRHMENLYFRIGETMVHVQGQLRGDLPSQIKGIKFGGRGRLLHLLHATQMGVTAGTEIGAYVVHYADGSTERIPLVYGRNIVNWWVWDRPGFQDVPTGARVVWTGTNDATELNSGLKIRLLAQTWTNPHPEKEIATLDVVSANTLCDPFLVAATLERAE